MIDLDVLAVVDSFSKYKGLKRKDLEKNLQTHSLLDLQVFATHISIIPNNSKEKMVTKISFKLTQKLKK